MAGLPWLQDYAALAEGSGVVPLADWSTLRVTGADRQTFLNNFCTNEVKSLEPGQGCEAFFCDAKGKIVAHAIVLVGTDDVLLVGVPGMAARLLPHLDRYIIREDAQIADASDGSSWALVGDEGIGKVVRVLIDGDEARERTESWRHGVAASEWGRLHISTFPTVWSDGVLLSTRPGDFQTLATDLDATPCAEEAWHALRIESGWPLFGVDFDETNLPQEVGRDTQTISFRKGCYLGQETVARIDALGHVNKQLGTVRFNPLGEAASAASPAQGAELLAAGQPAGRITSATWSPKLGAWLALAMLKRGSHEPGTNLMCGELPGEVIATPAPPPAK